MYRLAIGSIEPLCAQAERWLTPAQRAACRQRQQLAGRVLLARQLRHFPTPGPGDSNKPLPALIIRAGGKPAFADPHLPQFNLSHSGDRLALLIGGHQPLGCDIEHIRPRRGFMAIAAAAFSPACLHWLSQQPHPLPAFWQLWTAHEAILKQRGQGVWQMASLRLDPQHLAPAGLFCQSLQYHDDQLAICGPLPFEQKLTVSAP